MDFFGLADLENLRSWPTSVEASRAAVRISFSNGIAFSFVRRWRSASLSNISPEPIMSISELLKSCAIPLAIVPTTERRWVLSQKLFAGSELRKRLFQVERPLADSFLQGLLLLGKPEMSQTHLDHIGDPQHNFTSVDRLGDQFVRAGGQGQLPGLRSPSAISTIIGIKPPGRNHRMQLLHNRASIHIRHQPVDQNQIGLKFFKKSKGGTRNPSCS